jgi:hypothetical protein
MASAAVRNIHSNEVETQMIRAKQPFILHLRPPSGWMGHWEQNMIEAG